MRKTILTLFVILFCFSIGTAGLQQEELSKEEKAILKKAIEIIKKHEERELLELIREASEPKEKDDLSWLDKYPDLAEKEEQKKELSYWDGYEAAAIDYFKSLGVWKTDPEKLEEENDRLEDLLRKLRNEKSELEWDMMRYKSDLEWHMLELSSRLESDLLFNPLLSFPFDYRYTYPGYSKKMDPINYEALLFTLSTDSKGKMDWTKYGWLKLLLKNK